MSEQRDYQEDGREAVQPGLQVGVLTSAAGVGRCIGKKMESEEGRKRIQSHLYCLDSREEPEVCFDVSSGF